MVFLQCFVQRKGIGLMMQAVLVLSFVLLSLHYSVQIRIQILMVLEKFDDSFKTYLVCSVDHASDWLAISFVTFVLF
jgi:hypothetical protein